MWNCTHFRHPTDEQLQHVDIFFSNYYYNLQSVYFESSIETSCLLLVCSVSSCLVSFVFFFLGTQDLFDLREFTLKYQVAKRILQKKS